tara:strand:- start:1176 stop:2357 length:1182 start_codon:yes stop_codon:yes gene_type:complete
MIKKIFLILLVLFSALVSVVAIKNPSAGTAAWQLLTNASHFKKDVPSDEVLGQLKTARGFVVNVYAEGLDRPRMMHITEAGDVIVSDIGSDSIVLLSDMDNDGQADSRTTLLDERNNPHGVVLHDGWLYFAEPDRISRVRFDSDSRQLIGDVETLIDELPFEGFHPLKTLAISAAEQLYFNVGSPCNNCLPDDERYSTLMRIELDGSGPTIVASGLRNSVGFDWTPWSKELFATENSRDMLGDNFPPDELNHIVDGGFYGWPYYHGDNQPDPAMGQDRVDLLAVTRPPSFQFRPHNAPLGIHFLRKIKSLPSIYQRSAVVALHGSWNRSDLDGYKVISLHWDDDGSIQSRDFLSGFLLDQKVLGRPAGVIQDAQGSVYISDDLAGRIYRVRPN